MKRLLALILAVPLALGGLAAQAAPASVYEPVKAGPVTLKPDRAYILFRTNRPKVALGNFEQVFLRAPNATELASYRSAKNAAYDLLLPQLTKWGEGAPLSREDYPYRFEGWPNTFAVKVGDFLDDAGEERTYLIEVAPDDYVVIGQKTAIMSSLQICHCMGTVGFKAAPGVVTDLGSLLSGRTSERSAIPELAPVTGLDKTALMGAYDLAQAVRPATDATPVPAALSGVARRPAAFYAVGPSPMAGGYTFDRLAPLAGVLNYDGADVVDAKTGARLTARP